MLIGEHIHKLDEKRRVSLPAKFRKAMGKRVVITHGLDGCLSAYTTAEWQKISERLSELSMGRSNTRGFNRFMLSGATEVEIDSLGRILIPDYLANFAGLSEKVVIIGVHTRLEVWDEKKWKTYKKRIEGQADELAEKLGEIGMI